MVWIGVITFVAIKAGCYDVVDVFYNTENIISIDEPSRYLTLYFPVLGLGTLVTLATGKRGWCHYICWAGNFSALGTLVKNRFKWPSLHIEAGDGCVHCRKCSQVCSKSLDVYEMVQSNRFDGPECILLETAFTAAPRRI